MNINYVIPEENYFIMTSSYDLSLEEQKLILTLASMVNPDDEDFKSYILKISDFVELLEIDNDEIKNELPKITKDLMRKVFEIQDENSLVQVAWLNNAIYEEGSDIVTLKFSPDLKPYMLKLNSMFNHYELASILSMKSKYSPRIYEILKYNKLDGRKYIEIEIDDLRKLLRTENIYPRYNDFKRKIIEQAQKELKKLSDIRFDFEEIKTGRKITGLKLCIYSNSPKNKVYKEMAATIKLSTKNIYGGSCEKQAPNNLEVDLRQDSNSCNINDTHLNPTQEYIEDKLKTPDNEINSEQPNTLNKRFRDAFKKLRSEY